MALPSFPPQDLAKLVLGYLAEEQLMTAYDEFLQASPYLDAFRNEYDRIFMTSLKSILAEYRAIKIYVETCKPHPLRKKLFQCSNLLEVVKNLVSLIDPSKLQIQETCEKSSFTKQTVLTQSNITCCELCNSTNIDKCFCKNKNGDKVFDTEVHSPSSVEVSIESSVETTSLADLPGNATSTIKKKSLNEANTFLGHNKDEKTSFPKSCTASNNLILGQNIYTNVLPNTITSVGVVHTGGILQVNKVQTNGKDVACSQKIEEFNNIFQQICNKSSNPSENIESCISSGNDSSNVSQARGFKEFASGVRGRKEKGMRTQDIQTTPTLSLAPKPMLQNIIPITNIKGPPITQPPSQMNIDHVQSDSLELNKPHDPKVTIISDIKVDKHYPTCGPIQPSVKVNATSTPYMHMQTIFINGTPAYTKRCQPLKSGTYSKDEIMAMPTIILVPSSGAHMPIAAKQVTVSSGQNCRAVTSVSNAPSREFTPLIINISAGNTVPYQNLQTRSASEMQCTVTKSNEMGLVKTVDTITHASLPKDNTAMNKTSTPHVLPPIRKSCSTPRRTSHVRVLDFTTPRRILENENELLSNNDDVVIICDSPKGTETKNNMLTINPLPSISQPKEKVKTTINKQNNFVKKRNWDDELRSLVGNNEAIPQFTPQSTRKFTKNKKRVSSKHGQDKSTSDKKDKKKPSKDLKAGKNLETSESTKEIINLDDNHVSGTINKETVNNNINTNCDDLIDTPESERLSLQNVIGAKLNISELLETPYKQAIYDIQMETPRFLGPDLPDEPVSDIKIMNIPTPRFFNSTPAQATPSSYSSRPTDYSSGGSYYKPDDQDYMHISEDGSFKDIEENNVKNVSSSKVDEPKQSKSESKDKSEDKSKSSKTKRPIRKCAKNVSYYNSPNVKANDNSNVRSSVQSKRTDKTPKAKIVKNNKDKENVKFKYKSPLKNDSFKSFMKIKPRRVTPIKDVTRNKTSPARSRKKSISKDKTGNTVPTQSVLPVKSRRKSSTPRKLDCNKLFNSSNSSNNSPDTVQDQNPVNQNANVCTTSSNNEPPLRWFDDSSAKDNESSSFKESEDIISKIKEYIDTIDTKKVHMNDRTGNLQNDLIKRGFDIETARIIERDLLDTPPIQDDAVQSTSGETKECNMKESSDLIESDKQVILSKSDTNPCVNSVEQEEEDEIEDLEFAVHDNNMDCKNYFSCTYNENAPTTKSDIAILKDKFSMEVCIDDGVTIRLRAIDYNLLYEQAPENEVSYDSKEIESAVNSISGIDKLYTPMKDHKAKCFEIFDSTLTSIDTPLKSNSPNPKEHESTVTEIVLEVENISSSKTENKKRKRVQTADDNDIVNKKCKPANPYLLNPANIQNIDIESVLSKLHGP